MRLELILLSLLSTYVLCTPVIIDEKHPIQTAKAACPIYEAVCLIYCPFGNAVDQNGCIQPCKCNSNPSPNLNGNILPIIANVVCPMIGCLNICPNGYIKDEKGCDTCKCK